jgi:exopolyphosphatase/guanosine-5'-triphosphate,3'-diphosphate pyrophosphatase
MHKAGFFRDKFLSKQIWKSAVKIGEKYQFDKKHAMQVSRLSLEFYDSLKELHNLAPRHRLILKLAALWHDIGIFILNSEHHKHSHSLISNIELPGLSKRDIYMIAAIARYHRRSMPKKYHEEYKMLTDRDRVVVSKLAAILRIADALDRSHSQSAGRLRIESEENNIVVYAMFKDGGWIERMHFETKKDLFLRVFGTNIELVESVE